MPQSQWSLIVSQLRTLVGRKTGSPNDGELLARFIAQTDRAAFAELLERHGSMVYNVCRRLLRGAQDAEDAWQATFLVLAQKARTIRRPSIAAWLHGVARRVSLKIRAREARRKCVELPDDSIPDKHPDNVCWREFQAVLDEELVKLPDRFRQPLVLCYLEGKTRDEAAAELGWSVTTFRGRLDTAREKLRTRLQRRGFSLSVASLAATLGQVSWASAIPRSCVERVLREATSKSISRYLASLGDGGIHIFSASKVPVIIGSVAVAVCLVSAGPFILNDHESATALTLRAAEQPKPPVSKLKATPWGEPVNGVSIRLRRLKKAYGLDEIPSFELDLRYEGKKAIEIARLAALCDIEVDGLFWYSAGVKDTKNTLTKIESGERVDGWVKIQLDRDLWKRSPKRIVDQTPLKLSPGKHTIRLAYQIPRNETNVRGNLEEEVAAREMEGAKLELDAATNAIVYYRANLDIERTSLGAPDAVVAVQRALAKAISESATRGFALDKAIAHAMREKVRPISNAIEVEIGAIKK